MKIRNGFVSNSSSSSFIIGIAEIVNKDLLIKAFKEHNIDYAKYYDDVSIMRSTDIAAKSQGYYSDMHIADNDGEAEVELSSFSGASVYQKLGKTEDLAVAQLEDKFNKEWLVIDYTGNEGDDAFYCDGYDIDYDISESFFAGSVYAHILDWMKEPEKYGLKNAQYRIGAARNG